MGSRAPRRRSISLASISSTRASPRAVMASVSTSITCWRTTARRSPTTTGRWKSSRHCGARCRDRRMGRLRGAGGAPTQRGGRFGERSCRSVLELTAGDRPGLLCEVGKVLMAERVELHAAKIMTVGERAEDVFYLTDFDNRPLEPAAAERLRERLVQALDERQAALRI